MKMLTANEVAARLGISLRTFYRLTYFRQRRRHPTGTRAVRYELADVEAYEARLRAVERAA